MASGDWHLVPAGDFATLQWSYGAVKDVPSLYGPATFGPKEDNRCDCGKYVGVQYEGILCDHCGVKIFADAADARYRRPGHIWLACWCDHPVTGRIIEAFPVAPIALRTTPDGTPNDLGRKYEALIRLNSSAADALPPKGSEDYYPAAREFDRAGLSAAMRDILIGAGTDPPADTSILGLLFKAMATASPYLSHLVRCYGYALKAEVTL